VRPRSAFRPTSGPTQSLLQPQGTRKHLTSIRRKRRSRLNVEPALMLALAKIRPPDEVLACQSEAHRQLPACSFRSAKIPFFAPSLISM
jgi:hypothetical protein